MHFFGGRWCRPAVQGVRPRNGHSSSSPLPLPPLSVYHRSLGVLAILSPPRSGCVQPLKDHESGLQCAV